MMKRLLSLLLVLCMLLTALPMTALADSPELVTSTGPQTTEPTVDLENPFTDVDEDDWCYDAVQYVRVNGIFNGTTTTTFSPNNSLTRGMFVTVLGRMAGVDPSDYSGDTGFTDVPTNKYYAPYIAWAVKYGITNGVTEDTFCPNNPVTRQQMAAFFVRYFEAFDVDYETGANITTIPADLDSVSNYAKDAVLKLWEQGLLNGNGVSFKPTSNASRAHAATLCMRADKAVDTWYSEPGVASERVSIDPATGEAENNSGTVIIPNNPNYDYTTYYEVEFCLADGQDATGVTLPATKTYPAGTEITLLPTPSKQNGVFLGWYYDAAAENPVGPSDTLTRNVTLYAKMGEVTAVSEQETPNYITITVPANAVGSYSFSVSEDAENCLESFVHVSNLNSELTKSTDGSRGTNEYSIVGNVITATLEAGQTYSVRLAEDSSAVFVIGGTAQPSTVRVLNIITEKNEVQNLTLNGGVKYLPFTSVSDMTGTALDGLFVASVDPQETGAIQQNKNEGTFTYDGGDLAVGDTVAIYEGTQPNLRTDESMNEAVAYVKITAIDGTSYSYETADSEEVLFTPDVLPISVDADTDDVENQITVDADVLDFTDDKYTELGLDSQTVVEKGDFIAFYTGNDPATGASAGYGKISSVTVDGDTYIITYTTALQDEVLAAMDLYSTRNEEIELTEEERQQIEASMVEQALDSGFVDEAAEYLTALAIETDGFQELSDDLDMDLSAYSITFADGTPVDPDAMDLMAVQATITNKDVSAKVLAGTLTHFEDGTGIRAELVMTFTVEIGSGDNKLEITLEAIFEQEVMLTINVSGGAIWKWKWIIPYIYDYQMNANIDVGTYTGIGITATAKTKGPEGEDEGFDWNMSTGNKAGDKIISIGKQIKDLMDQKEEFMGKFTVPTVGLDGEEAESAGTLTNGGLAEKYADMMENAEESWIEIVRVEIFSAEGHVDPFHILCYGIGADFVVSANMYVTLGMTFEYGVAKRYNFSLMLFHKKSTNETIDLEEAHYQFDFYVMGTMGVRAGIEFEIAIGLFSLKLDSIGICAEAGAYAQLWGYFYYSLSWSESEGKSSTCAGAMLIEIGAYLEISFKAQLFSSDKLTYQPTLYENEWLLLSIGEAENVYDFAYEDDDESLNMEVIAATEFALSSDLFAMNYMDMKSGDLYGSESEDEDEDGEPDNPAGNYDDATESHYTITLSNPKFSYNPNGNIVTVDPDFSTEETCEITIRWNHGTLAFSARPITRTLTIEWSDPANARYISFNSKGGSAVSMIAAAADAAISAPANPTKIGYTFAGWYQDAACTTPFTVPSTMPNYLELTNGAAKGITVYAKWTPNTDTKYTVEHYLEQLNGTYKLVQVQQGVDEDGAPIMVDEAPEQKTGTTDALTAAAARTYPGFTAKSFVQKAIAPDGSTVVKIYYYRNTYTVNFTYGAYAAGNDPLTYTAKYGATLYAPSMALGGYEFTGYTGLTTDADGGFAVTGNATYNAAWTPSSDTPYRVEHYIQRTGGSGYLLAGDNAIISLTGTTGSEIDVSAVAKLSDPGLTYIKATVGGEEITAQNPATIAADGSTVVKLYYDRKNFDLILMDGETELDTIPSRYGSVLTTPTVPTKQGYTFATWHTDVDCTDSNKFDFGTFTMPAEAVTLYASWTANTNTAYTVEHYWQNIEGAGYTKHTTDELTGTTGEDTAAVAKDYSANGFKPANSFDQAEIKADGTTVVKIYYDRKTYDVTFNSNGGSDVEKIEGVRHGATVTAPAEPTKTGYTFDGWYLGETKWNFSTATVTEAVTLTAKWAEADGIAYTVEVYEMGVDGTYGEPTSQTKYGKTNATVTASTTAPDGFTYDQGHEGEIVSGSVAADGSLLLKVYFKRNQYTVTYDTAGGTAVDSFTGYLGASVPDPATTTRTGYAFAGWENAQSTVPLNGATVTAKWTANSYTVSFEKNAPDGVAIDGTMANQPFTYDKAQNLKANAFTLPANSGYTFIGWAITEGGEVKYTDGYSALNLTAEANGNVTLYAVWKQGDSVTYTVEHYQQNVTGSGYTLVDTQTPNGIVGTLTGAAANSYTGFTAQSFEQVTVAASGTAVKIYYDRNQHTLTFNDGTQDIVSETVYYGAAISAPADPTKTGHTFAGWGAEVLSVMPDDDLTYTAKWTVNKYTVTFANTGDSTIAAITQDYGTTVTAPADPTKEGYTFTGWDKTIPATMPAENMTITANWSINRYTITFNTNGGSEVASITRDYGATISVPAAPTKTGYTFDSWDKTIPATMPAQNMTITANWTANTYTVIFSSQCDLPHPEDITVTYGEPYGDKLPTLSRTGYTFDGWYTLEGTQVTAATIVSEETLGTYYGTNILWAEWTPIQYTIAFEENGGSTMTDITQGYETAVTKPADPTKTGCTFEGWYTDSGFSNAYTFPEKMPAENVTLYAKWSENNYSITYVVNYGGTYTNSNPTFYASTESFTLAAPTATGLKFYGWYTDPDFAEDSKVTAIASGTTGDLTLYAKCTCLVTFDFAGYGTDEVVEVAYGGTVTLPAIPARAATAEKKYTAAGWTSNIDSSTANVGAEVTVTQGMTYTAGWTETDRSYSLTWDFTDCIRPTSGYHRGEFTYTTSLAVPTTVGKSSTAAATYTLSGWTVTCGTKTYTIEGAVSSITLQELTGATVPEADELVFVPQFTATARLYTVTFVTNDSQQTVDSARIAYGSTFAEPQLLERVLNGVSYTPTWYSYNTGYSQYGWTAWDFAASTVTTNVTLCAAWSPASTSDTEYGLYVGGVQLTSANSSNIPLPAGASGSATYDQASRTLTLNNVQMSSAALGYRSAVISTDSEELLTIKLVGNCTLNAQDVGILAKNVRIVGSTSSASLTLTGAIGFYLSGSSNLYVNNCTLNINGSGKALLAGANIYMEDNSALNINTYPSSYDVVITFSGTTASSVIIEYADAGNFCKSLTVKTADSTYAYAKYYIADGSVRVSGNFNASNPWSGSNSSFDYVKAEFTYPYVP